MRFCLLAVFAGSLFAGDKLSHSEKATKELVKLTVQVKKSQDKLNGFVKKESEYCVPFNLSRDNEGLLVCVPPPAPPAPSPAPTPEKKTEEKK